MYDMLDLASSLKTVAEFARSGMADEAAELRAGLVTLLNVELDVMFEKVEAAMADDPVTAGQGLIFCATVLRVYGPYVGGLSITLQQVLAKNEQLLRSLGQDEAVAATQRMLAPDFIPFYPISSSSQIIILDALYQRCFGRRKAGRFVEIGAFDGDTYSNTSALADLGWQGLYIEPMPTFFDRCRSRHAKNPAVTTVNLAVGAASGRAFMVDKGALTQIRQGYERDAVEVEIRRLDDILTEQELTPGFDLLVVDVEGFEGEVFAGFDLARWRPSAIIIELSDLSPLDAAKRAIRDRILATGYRLIFQDAINSLFVQARLLRA